MQMINLLAHVSFVVLSYDNLLLAAIKNTFNIPSARIIFRCVGEGDNHYNISHLKKIVASNYSRNHFHFYLKSARSSDRKPSIIIFIFINSNKSISSSTTGETWQLRSRF